MSITSLPAKSAELDLLGFMAEACLASTDTIFPASNK
jgi:hypothetical protein